MSRTSAAHSLARCAFLVVAALALHTAHGLRTHLARRQWWDEGPTAGADTEDLVRKVPDIGNFTEKWRNFTAHGLHGSTQPDVTMARRRSSQRADQGNPRGSQSRRILMVVGIFTTMDSQDKPFREVIRSTWMTQPGICRLEEIHKPPPDCYLFVTFVVGNRSGVPNAVEMQEERRQRDIETELPVLREVETHERRQPDIETDLPVLNETDVLAVNASESINCGKTRSWFEYASQQYLMATHIAKMDMDAFLDTRRFKALLHDFQDEARCPYVYGGRPWHCLEDLCPPKRCGRPIGTDFKEYGTVDPTCWTYMQGGFYYMSRPLAEATAVPGGFWNFAGEVSGDCLPEDTLAGSAVDHFARETGSCVSVMNMVGQEAIWHADWYGSWTTQNPNSFPE